MSLDKIIKNTFKIDMLGKHGLTINDHKETHVLRSLV
jgi:hypothetical protein